MRRAASAVLALACLLLAACNSVGPRAIRSARFPYNEALIQTWNEQLLLNLVRLRYRDTPYFLQATSLTTQYELSGAASAGATLMEGGGNEGSLGTGVFVAETPTVSYVPLQGEKLVKQLMNRIPLDDVMLLPQSGWSIERVLRLTVDRLGDIPNAPSTTGPTPGYRPHFEDFEDFTCHLRRLQIQGKVTLQVERVDADGDQAKDGDSGEDDDPTYRYTLQLHDTTPHPREVPPTVERCDYETPAPEDGSDHDVREVRRAFTEALATTEADASVTGKAPPTSIFLLSLPGEGPDRARRKLVVPLTPRSLMGTLYFLSQAVEIPAPHLEKGLATRTAKGRTGCTPPPSPGGTWRAPGDGDWARQLHHDFFRIHCSETRPERAFVHVRYRDHWYYIADHDLATKSTWGLLSQLVSLQAGGEARGLVHALTLSAGR